MCLSLCGCAALVTVVSVLRQHKRFRREDLEISRTLQRQVSSEAHQVGYAMLSASRNNASAYAVHKLPYSLLLPLDANDVNNLPYNLALVWL